MFLQKNLQQKFNWKVEREKIRFMQFHGPFGLRGEGGRMEESRVELVKNRLILSQIYSLLPLNPNGKLMLWKSNPKNNPQKFAKPVHHHNRARHPVDAMDFFSPEGAVDAGIGKLR